MQTQWDVHAAHAYVNERRAVLTVQQLPIHRTRKRTAFFQRLVSRIISLFWL